MKQVILAIFLGLIIVTSARAGQKQDGGLPGSLMNLAVDARILGMGRAGVADPESGIFWNPAGAAFVRQQKVMLMSTSPFPDCRHTIGSYHLPFQQSWSVGLGYLHSIIQDIERRDSLNAPLDTFSSNNDAWFLSGSRLFLPALSGGISLKMIDGDGHGVDIGLLFKPLDTLSLGVNLQNIIQPKTSSDAGENEEAISRNIKVGFAGEAFGNLLLALDIDKNFEREAKFHFGSEYSPWDALSIRAGYDQGLGPALGFGLKRWGINLDYACLGHKYEAVHRVSANFKFGQEREKQVLWKRIRGKESDLIVDGDQQEEVVYTIAVAYLDIRGVSEDLALTATDLLANKLLETRVFNVKERLRMKEILEERGYQAAVCIDEACAVKMGKDLKVPKMLIGSFSQVSDKFYIITVRVVDVETEDFWISGEVDFTSIEDELSNKVKELANLLARKAMEEAVK
ncbi:MAG: CsgG/HfaB family protein [bacterium]|nr:CsgG/HfaB family protein [bacterium]